jgi:hypothetical protein
MQVSERDALTKRRLQKTATVTTGPLPQPKVTKVLDFIFSYNGFATAFFAVCWIVAIYKHLEWWEYLCLAFLHCVSYIDRRNDWNWPVKIYLGAQLIAGGIVAIGIIVLVVQAILKSIFK